MDHRARTFKALAALAASMTAATAFLSWLEPKSKLAAASAELVAQSIRSAISVAGSIDLNAWQAVEIVPTREIGSWRGRALTAVAPASEHHFRITDTGQVEASPAWQAQSFDPSAGAIRILVYTPTESNPAAPSYKALKALLVELRSLAGPHHRPVTLPLTTAEIAPLHELLVRDGLLG